MNKNNKVNMKEASFKEIISTIESLYGPLSESVTQQAWGKYSRGEIDSALPKAIAVIRLKYNDFDPEKTVEGYSCIPYESGSTTVYDSSDAMPYPLGSIVPGTPESLLEHWGEVESLILQILSRIQLESLNKWSLINDTALKNERLMYLFLQEVSRKSQPLLEGIWQEVEVPGSVLNGQALPAHLLLKAWVIMDFEHEADFEDACPDSELLFILQLRIQEESALGYLSSDEAFMSYAVHHYPVSCIRSEASAWMQRFKELSDLETQLSSRVDEGDLDEGCNNVA